MVILIWLQVGFAMILLSSAIKGVPEDTLEAARIDGASEWQIFWRVVIPQIKGTIITVFITVTILVLKVFDIVYVMTNGRFNSNVIANLFFNELFAARQAGRASAIVVILLLAVTPILIYQVRHFRREEANDDATKRRRTHPTGARPTMPDPMSSAPKETGRRSWFSILVMLFLCVLWTIPTLGLLVTSFRSRDDSVDSGWWTAILSTRSAPGGRWTTTTGCSPAPRWATRFINTIVVAIPATIIPIMFAAFAAYAFTFMDFRGKDVLFVADRRGDGRADAGGPAADAQPARPARARHLRSSYLAVWLLHTGFGMPLAIYVLRNYMSTLPRTVIESAKIDGATHFQTFWKLIVPMSVPALAAFAILQFLWVWNDLLIAKLFLSRGQHAR